MLEAYDPGTEGIGDFLSVLKTALGTLHKERGTLPSEAEEVHSALNRLLRRHGSTAWKL